MFNAAFKSRDTKSCRRTFHSNPHAVVQTELQQRRSGRGQCHGDVVEVTQVWATRGTIKGTTTPITYEHKLGEQSRGQVDNEPMMMAKTTNPHVQIGPTEASLGTFLGLTLISLQGLPQSVYRTLARALASVAIQKVKDTNGPLIRSSLGLGNQEDLGLQLPTYSRTNVDEWIILGGVDASRSHCYKIKDA